MKRGPAIFILIILSLSIAAQTAESIDNLSQTKTPEGLLLLKEFLSLPNDALNTGDIKKNVVWLNEAFQSRGFETEVLPTSNTPLFLAKREFSKKAKTVLFYMHFDGQGVDPEKWDQEDPYKAVLRQGDKDINWDRLKEDIDPEWRIYARSSSDDKGPIVMFLSAIDILDEHFGGESRINLKVILDGEEEKGSGQLPPAVEKYRDKLKADYMIINDGPIHSSDRPTIVFGGRGIRTITLTTYGPRTQQHSGHYGNYAPNPVFRMAHLLASIKDRQGRVIIPGYYDGIELNDIDKLVMMDVPDDANKINEIIGIAEPDRVGAYYQEALQYPSFNVRGMQSAWVGEQVRTIVPEKAVAAIDMRLVPESDPDRLVKLLHQHIVDQGNHVIDRDPSEEERQAYPKIVKMEVGRTTMPFRTSLDSEIRPWLENCIREGTGKEPVIIRTMGGTVPIAPFVRALDIPAVIIPLVNGDNNQHAPNENLRIWNFTNGIKIFLSIMTQ